MTRENARWKGEQREKREEEKPETRNEVTASGGMNNARHRPLMGSFINCLFSFFLFFWPETSRKNKARPCAWWGSRSAS